jgi:hypothetical protein
VKLYGSDRRELMTISAIERNGNQLTLKGKVFGTMPLSASLTPGQAREGLKLLGLRGIFFILTMLFRKDP